MTTHFQKVGLNTMAPAETKRLVEYGGWEEGRRTPEALLGEVDTVKHDCNRTRQAVRIEEEQMKIDTRQSGKKGTAGKNQKFDVQL